MIVQRPTLERRVLGSLDAGRIPVLLGGCGTGRTSLLLRLEEQIGRSRAQYLDLAAAATTPERCLQTVTAANRLSPPPAVPPSPASSRAARGASRLASREAPAARRASVTSSVLIPVRSAISLTLG